MLAFRYESVITEARFRSTLRTQDLLDHLNNSNYTEQVPSRKTPEIVQEAERMLFMEMCDVSLWGNASDLGLLTTLTYEDILRSQGIEARKKAEQNILVNDLPAAWKILLEGRDDLKRDRRVDIILDNAGFELLADLVLAGYLLSADLASQVVLHPKSMPWFVSDVLPWDFASLLGFLANPQGLYTTAEGGVADRNDTPLSLPERSNLSHMFQDLSRLHEDGQLMIRPNPFWTTAHSFWRMPELEPRLFQDLKESELVIFKGDLNYRKLTFDVRFDFDSSRRGC